MVSAVPYGADMSKKNDGADFNRQAEELAMQAGIVADAFKPAQDHIRENVLPGLLRIEEMLQSEEHRPEVPHFEFDDSHIRTAEATAQMAAQTEALVGLTRSAVQLAQASKDSSDKVERFTRRMSWASFWVSVGSTIVAIASLAVAIVALAN